MAQTVKKEKNATLQCDICDKMFSHVSSLRKHKRNIHNVQMLCRQKGSEYPCSDCHRWFSRRSNLKRHRIRAHNLYTMERLPPGNTVGRKRYPCFGSFICDPCGEIYNRKDRLRKHIRSRHVPEVIDFELLRELLPESTVDINVSSYKILNYEMSHFIAKFTIKVFDKEDFEQWLNEFQYKNKITLRKRSVHRVDNLNLLYHMRYGCHHNTKPRPGSKVSAKHTECSATLTLRLYGFSNSMNNYAEIKLAHTHNHVLDSTDVLKFREPIDEVKRKFRAMFLSGMTPSQALQQHRKELEEQYGDEFKRIVHDRGLCPNKSWVYNYRCTSFRKVKTSGGDDSSGSYTAQTVGKTELMPLNEYECTDYLEMPTPMDTVMTHYLTLQDVESGVNTVTKIVLPVQPRHSNFECKQPSDSKNDVLNDKLTPYFNGVRSPELRTLENCEFLDSKIELTPEIAMRTDQYSDGKHMSEHHTLENCELLNEGITLAQPIHTSQYNSVTYPLSAQQNEMRNSSILNERVTLVSETVLPDMQEPYEKLMEQSFDNRNSTVLNMANNHCTQNKSAHPREMEDVLTAFDGMNILIKNMVRSNPYLVEGVWQMIQNFKRHLRDSFALNDAMHRFGKH